MIVDNTSLTAAITEWLARDQDATLIARIPTFIQFCEAQLNRSLFVRQMETRSTALTTFGVTDCEYIALPSDFQSMRRIRLTSANLRPTLDFMSTVQLDEYRSNQGDVPQQPQYFTIFGGEIELAPTPDQVYTVEMVYRQNVPPLGTNGTNWLITIAPDLYLYGSLIASAPYIKKDMRLQTWGTLYAAALKDLNDLETTSAFNAGPVPPLSTSFHVSSATSRTNCMICLRVRRTSIRSI
jgi:hypothetical protein